jgi:uncharacterized protein with ATP-grasp and redox domains
MLIWPDCIPCILRMSLAVSRKALKDEEQVWAFMKNVLQSEPFIGDNLRVTSPEIVRDIWVKLVALSGNRDPLKEEKQRQNHLALQIYSAVKEYVFECDDPFLEALKLSIAGNAMDAIVGLEHEPPGKHIEELKSRKIDAAKVSMLKDRLGSAKKVLYFSDNCGEIVFDRLLLEVIKADRELDVTVVTRTTPVVNDATVEDAISIGLGKLAHVMGNGIQKPTPSTILEEVSPQVKDLVDKADLVISKGGANYELLSAKKALAGKTTFLFLGKCHPLCSIQGVPFNTLIVHHY